MNSIKNTADLVKQVLMINPKARNSDNYLYYVVCKVKLAEQGIDIDKLSFREGLLQRNEFGLPNFETVRRTRQKIQHDNPELSAHSDVKAQRAILEEAYREFARGC